MITAPYGKVRFRDSFLTNIVSSTAQPLRDFGTVFSFLTSVDGSQPNEFSSNVKSKIPLYITIIGILPYYWRFCQCFKKYIKQDSKPQAVNAGKYFSKLLPYFVLLYYKDSKFIGNEGFYIWLTTIIIASLYSIAWEYYMDWGLLRSKKTGKYGLRDKILFPPNFYYFAMIMDLFFRFFWIIGLYRASFS